MWLALTSIAIVPPQSVVTYRVIGREGKNIVMPVVPIANSSTSTAIRLKWPIFFGGIGFVDERFSLDPSKGNEFQTKFGLYQSSERGGPDNTVDVVMVKGSFSITDHDKFFLNVDLDEANIQASREPFAKRYKTRSELVAAYLVNALNTQELRQRVALWERELLWRRNFVLGIVKELGIGDAAEIKTFIKEKAPWFWMGYETFWEAVLERESLIGFRYQYEPSWTRGSNDPRVYDPNEPLKLYLEMSKLAWEYGESAKVYRQSMPKIEAARAQFVAAASKDPAVKAKLEKAALMVMEFKKALAEMVPGGIGAISQEQANELQSLVEQYLQYYAKRSKIAKLDPVLVQLFMRLVSLEWSSESLKLQQARMQRFYEKELLPYFTNLLTDKGPIGKMWHRVYTEKENDLLWDAAIDEVLTPTVFKDIEQWTKSAGEALASGKEATWKVLSALFTVETKAGRELVSSFIKVHGADVIKARMQDRIRLVEQFLGIDFTTIAFSVDTAKCQENGVIDPDIWDICQGKDQ
jgi:hypothetical protein